jgi:flagellar biosynthesis/type III secretory pathway chaperone
MKNVIQNENYKRLIGVLSKEIGIYRHLLDIVRGEKETIIKADVIELEKTNRAKEVMIPKLSNLERARLRICQDLGGELGIASENPRLLEMASKVDDESADKLRNIHKTLELLVKRVKSYNLENEKLIQVSLETLHGSMDAVRKSWNDKPTYQKAGQIKENKSDAGRLVSREA